MIPGIIASGQRYSSSGDPYWASVTLSMHMDDAGLTDARGKAITLNGGAARSATQSKFGGYSAYFDGAGDYLSIADTSALKFGTGNFTVECWLYLSAMPGSQGAVILGRGEYGLNSDWIFQLNASGQMAFWLNTAVDFVVTVPALTTGQWYHLAVVRSGNQFYGFKDGAMTTGSTSSGSTELSGSGNYTIGADANGDEQQLNGYVDELRVTKAAKWTSSFTVPSAAYPDA